MDNKCSFSSETLGQTVKVLHIINVCCSVRKNHFSVRKSDFSVRKSDFSVRKNNFSVRKNVFFVRKIDFSVRKTHFSVRKTYFSVRTHCFFRMKNFIADASIGIITDCSEKLCFCMFPYGKYFIRIGKLHFSYGKYYCACTETCGDTIFSARKI